jgi:outer membrane receptor protein involved in Fe transport
LDRTSLAACLVFAATAAQAQTFDVTVRERRPVTSGSSYVVEGGDFSLRRLDKPDQVLEQVPPLLSAQHAGGGKANQYLVRGFDADHGTDFAFFFDSMPVNFRSHAHGQGYTDFTFFIPETIERIDVAMGPYSVEFGDFATAGAANLIPFTIAPEPFLKAEGGQWESVRTVGMWSPRTGAFSGGEQPGTLLVAAEFNTTDGPFQDGENLLQYKGFARLGWEFDERSRLEGWLSLYDGDWHGSGQVPERLVRSPGFDRWDSVDPTEGGDSDRQSALLRFVHEPGPGRHLEATAWVAHYALDLYSNFTFFLNDPVNGDGIVQSDDRIYTGGSLVYRHALDVRFPTVLTAGLDTRTDFAGVRLGHQRERQRLDPYSDDDVVETSVAGFLQGDTLVLPWARFVGGVRLEGFRFDVENRCGTCTSEPGNPDADPRAEGTEYDGVALPKANWILTPFASEGLLPVETPAIRDAQLFLNWGIGYHSNDARNVVANPDERTLPLAMGWEVGWKVPVTGWADLSLAGWWLNLQNEVVFVGDEGTTEVRPGSERRGIELAARAHPWEWLEGELAVAYSSARYGEDDAELGIRNGDVIAQAPRFVAKARVRATHESGLSGELAFRALGERYAVDGEASPRLSDYGVFDFGARYRRGPFEAFVLVENVFDTQWRSAEFYFESFVPGFDAAPTEDFHFVPGNPRNVRAGLTWFLP